MRVDARTPVNFTMGAPVFRAMQEIEYREAAPLTQVQQQASAMLPASGVSRVLTLPPRC